MTKAFVVVFVTSSECQLTPLRVDSTATANLHNR